ncbi:MAG: hypothetical protein KDA27_17445 [Candidatus Eisenbacteria bacterium]|uniref:Uncharacterized protein n=1 Tax=Eiseniibacteriota bacterium TaxID=2212470 RepID=A0A956SFK0_UNCEI|nr:hypothetical protein [Candidatus Eisenbacteria bacterium]MCB9463349.1 hypothetical protein [Candidatus Eisenbacteria bacterium]
MIAGHLRNGRARSLAVNGRGRSQRGLRALPWILGPAALGGVLCLAPRVDASGIEVVRIPASYRTWEIGDSDSTMTVSQLHVPIVTSIGLGESADLVLSTAYGSSTVEPPSTDGTASASDLSMNGNGDVKGQLFVRLLDNRLLLQAGLGVPAGKVGLDTEQLTVVQALGNPLLGFRMKHYGEGLDLSGGAAFAVPLGSSVTAAVGAGFVTRGAYEFVAGEDDFKPGQETSVSGGVDILSSGARPALRLDASYRMFGADQLGDNDIFQEGNQLELQATTSFRPATARIDLTGRYVLKDDNEILDPPGTDVEKIVMDAGTAFFVQGEAGFLLGSAFLGVSGNLTSFDGGEDGDGTTSEAAYTGSTFGVGPVLEFGLGDSGRLRLGGQYLTGSIDERTLADETVVPSIDLSGFDVVVSLSWSPGAR